MTEIIATNSTDMLSGVATSNTSTFNSTYANFGVKWDYSTQKIHTFANTYNEFWQRLDIYPIIDTYFQNEGVYFPLFFTDGSYFSTVHIKGSTNTFRTYDGTGAFANNTFVMSNAALQTMDLHVIRDNGDSTSTVELYLNESLVASRTGSINGKTVATKISVGGSGSSLRANTVFSNLHVSDVSTIGRKFRACKLETVGTYNEFLGAGFSGLNDGNPVSYAHANTAGARVSGTIDYLALPGGAGTISAVALSSTVRAEGPSVNPDSIAHFIRVANTNYDQSAIIPSGYRQSFITTLATNPATSLSWVQSDLENMEFGLLSANSA